MRIGSYAIFHSVSYNGAIDMTLFSKCFTHLYRMHFPILINWMSPFPILGLLGGIFHLDSIFKRNFCKQTVENLAASDLVLHWLPMSHKKDARLICIMKPSVMCSEKTMCANPESAKKKRYLKMSSAEVVCCK